jgi:hypothetical protein
MVVASRWSWSKGEVVVVQRGKAEKAESSKVVKRVAARRTAQDRRRRRK